MLPVAEHIFHFGIENGTFYQANPVTIASPLDRPTAAQILKNLHNCSAFKTHILFRRLVDRIVFSCTLFTL